MRKLEMRKTGRFVALVLSAALALASAKPLAHVVPVAMAQELMEENGIVKGQSVESSVSDSSDADSQTNKDKGKKPKKAHTKKTKKKKFDAKEEEWNIQQINADGASTQSATNNAAIKVALIDSGIDYTEDIDVAERKNFILGDEEVSVIFEDLCGHGTGVAGILAAKDNDIGITGIAPGITLYSARVLDGSMKAPVSRAVEAIYWAIEKDVDIINISFSTQTDSAALKKAVQDAQDAGILIIAAAGNEGAVDYPAAYDAVVAVGSVNTEGEVSDFSAVGEEVELVAPGEQIKSTGELGGVGIYSGTSISAPHVAGVAAVLWAKDPSMDAGFIRSLLDTSANLYSEQQEYGYGLLDLAYAEQIYDDYKADYQARQQGIALYTEIPENVGEVLSFENVPYVVGAWSKDRHSAFVAENGTGDLRDSEVRAIKCGAVANDNHIPGMTAYPQWHGYWQKKTAPTGGQQEYKSNYMASYLYIMRIAASIPNNTAGEDKNLISYTAPLVPSEWRDINGAGTYKQGKDYFAITSVVTPEKFNNKDWDKVLVLNSTQLLKNNRKVKYFLYGTALHTLTDIFSHNSYYLNGTYISHASKKADDEEELENRLECASYMATGCMIDIVNEEIADISEFVDVIQGCYDGSFHLCNYSSYAEAIDSAYYKDNKSWFDSININK